MNVGAGIPLHVPSLHISVEPTGVLPDITGRSDDVLTGGVGSSAVTGVDPVPDPAPAPAPDPDPDPDPDANPGTNTIMLIVPTL